MAKSGPKPKGQEQLEAEADKARKKAVDAANKKAAKAAADKQAALAAVPLTSEEKEFVAKIAKRMNVGRRISMPSSADVLRYSQLKARLKV